MLSGPDLSTGKAVCRFCERPLGPPFLDLGMMPLANRLRTPSEPREQELRFPLRVHHCQECDLVQLQDFEVPERIFIDYTYFSSYSDSWLRHAERYCQQMIQKLQLNTASQVVEIASNDGYLLQHFIRQGVPVLGIEPAANVAKVAIEKGIPTAVEFFGRETARRLVEQGIRADLIVANNVLAHVPRIDDFVGGVAILLSPAGLVTFEFPHLARLIAEGQFDTIYHEHFSYLSLTVVERILAKHGLRVVDVEELPTHGGSLRVHARHVAFADALPTARVGEVRDAERASALSSPARYSAFAARVDWVRRGLLAFLKGVHARGESLAGYGAPAKATILLNACGIDRDTIAYTVDRSPHKQGLVIPGTDILVLAPQTLAETKPDFVLIFPWNLREEIMEQMSMVRGWGGRFVVALPEVTVYS
jgi:2-polyprenyl-3-methyl-5-hydroxy-6-metoxy-1,4-benzoquinol methylase